MEMGITPPMWWDPHFTLEHLTQVVRGCRVIMAKREEAAHPNRPAPAHRLAAARKRHAAIMAAAS